MVLTCQRALKPPGEVVKMQTPGPHPMTVNSARATVGTRESVFLTSYSIDSNVDGRKYHGETLEQVKWQVFIIPEGFFFSLYWVESHIDRDSGYYRFFLKRAKEHSLGELPLCFHVVCCNGMAQPSGSCNNRRVSCRFQEPPLFVCEAPNILAHLASTYP